MKGFLEQYRNITVWLSLFILAMGFVAASDEEHQMACMLFAFLAGVLLFGAGTAREWAVKNQPSCAWEELYENRIIENIAGIR